MMGERRVMQDALFYGFSLERHGRGIVVGLRSAKDIPRGGPIQWGRLFRFIGAER
jgi:hypothetical protein